MVTIPPPPPGYPLGPGPILYRSNEELLSIMAQQQAAQTAYQLSMEAQRLASEAVQLNNNFKPRLKNGKPIIGKWKGEDVTEYELEAYRARALRAERIERKHRATVIWEKVVSKKIDRIKVRMSMFAVYIGCILGFIIGLAAVTLALRGLIYLWFT